MVFRVDEDRIVGASCHTRLAPNADRLIEIDNAVGALEHCSRRAGSYARRMSALIATGDLVSAACLGKGANFDVLDVSARHRQRNKILGLTRCRARMATNTTRVINDLGPLNWSFVDHQTVHRWNDSTD